MFKSVCTRTSRVSLLLSKTPSQLSLLKPVSTTMSGVFTSIRNNSSSGISANEAADAELLKRIKIKPLKRFNEDRNKKIARLIYQSRKRGILETDILLSGFASKYLKSFTDAQLQEYDNLLNELDWDIYYWATKNYKITPLPERWENSEILTLLQEYSENKERKMMRVPELHEY